MNRIFQQQQQRAGNRADEGAEERNDVGNPDDHRDQQGGLEAHNQTPDEAQYADNGGVQQLADEKAVKHPVGQRHFLLDPLHPVGPENTVDHQLRLRRQLFPPDQQIGRHDDADQHIFNDGENGTNLGHRPGKQRFRRFRKSGIYPVVDLSVNLPVNPVPLLRVFRMGPHVRVDLVPQGGNLPRQHLDQIRQAVDHLGHHQQEDRENDQHRQQQHQRNRKALGQLFVFPSEPAQQQVLQLVAQRRRHIGQHPAVYKGHQDGGQPAQRFVNAAHIAGRQIKCNADQRNRQRGYADFQIFFILLVSQTDLTSACVSSLLKILLRPLPDSCLFRQSFFHSLLAPA